MPLKTIWVVYYPWKAGVADPIQEIYESEKKAREVARNWRKLYPKRVIVSKKEITPSKPEDYD